MRVYVVYARDFQCCIILSVFTTLEKALKYIDNLQKSDSNYYYEVEDFTLDKEELF